MGRRTTASVVPSVVGPGGRNDEFAVLQLDDVKITAYRHYGKIVVDVDAPAGQEIVVTLDDGDLFRGAVPE